jgi:hypothetical protein
MTTVEGVHAKLALGLVHFRLLRHEAATLTRLKISEMVVSRNNCLLSEEGVTLEVIALVVHGIEIFILGQRWRRKKAPSAVAV